MMEDSRKIVKLEDVEFNYLDKKIIVTEGTLINNITLEFLRNTIFFKNVIFNRILNLNHLSQFTFSNMSEIILEELGVLSNHLGDSLIKYSLLEFHMKLLTVNFEYSPIALASEKIIGLNDQFMKENFYENDKVKSEVKFIPKISPINIPSKKINKISIYYLDLKEELNINKVTRKFNNISEKKLYDSLEPIIFDLVDRVVENVLNKYDDLVKELGCKIYPIKKFLEYNKKSIDLTEEILLNSNNQSLNELLELIEVFPFYGFNFIVFYKFMEDESKYEFYKFVDKCIPISEINNYLNFKSVDITKEEYNGEIIKYPITIDGLLYTSLQEYNSRKIQYVKELEKLKGENIPSDKIPEALKSITVKLKLIDQNLILESEYKVFGQFYSSIDFEQIKKTTRESIYHSELNKIKENLEKHEINKEVVDLFNILMLDRKLALETEYKVFGYGITLFDDSLDAFNVENDILISSLNSIKDLEMEKEETIECLRQLKANFNISKYEFYKMEKHIFGNLLSITEEDKKESESVNFAKGEKDNLEKNISLKFISPSFPLFANNSISYEPIILAFTDNNVNIDFALTTRAVYSSNWKEIVLIKDIEEIFYNGLKEGNYLRPVLSINNQEKYIPFTYIDDLRIVGQFIAYLINIIKPIKFTAKSAATLFTEKKELYIDDNFYKYKNINKYDFFLFDLEDLGVNNLINASIGCVSHLIKKDLYMGQEKANRRKLIYSIKSYAPNAINEKPLIFFDTSKFMVHRTGLLITENAIYSDPDNIFVINSIENLEYNKGIVINNTIINIFNDEEKDMELFIYLQFIIKRIKNYKLEENSAFKLSQSYLNTCRILEKDLLPRSVSKYFYLYGNSPKANGRIINIRKTYNISNLEIVILFYANRILFNRKEGIVLTNKYLYINLNSMKEAIPIHQIKSINYGDRTLIINGVKYLVNNIKGKEKEGAIYLKTVVEKIKFL